MDYKKIVDQLIEDFFEFKNKSITKEQFADKCEEIAISATLDESWENYISKIEV